MDFEIQNVDALPQSSFSWSDAIEKIDDLGQIAETAAAAKAQSMKAQAAYNLAVVNQINQDTENKRVLVDYMAKAAFVIVLVIAGVFMIRAFKN